VSEASHTNHRKVYFQIFIALAVLTVVELFIPGMSMSNFAKGSSLTLIALGKAALVGWSYMHLNQETKWLRFIALIPIAAFCYAVMVILESLYR
jgi:cytochrome c oxidase subunit IV